MPESCEPISHQPAELIGWQEVPMHGDDPRAFEEYQREQLPQGQGQQFEQGRQAMPTQQVPQGAQYSQPTEAQRMQQLQGQQYAAGQSAGQQPPTQQQPGTQSPTQQPPTQQPQGTQPPAQQPTGAQPPAQQPPGTQPPAQQSTGAQPPAPQGQQGMQGQPGMSQQGMMAGQQGMQQGGQQPGGFPTTSGTQIQSVTLEEISRSEVVTVEPDESITNVVVEMADKDVGSVIVVEDDEPIGILTDRKIATSLGEMPDVADRTAGELISDGLVTGTPGMTIYDAVRQLRDEGIRRLPIVNDEGKLEGIVTLDDIIVLIAGELGATAEVIERQSPSR